MSTIAVETTDSITTLRFLKARGHSLDAALIADLRQALAEARERGDGVLLCASHPKVFSTGLDLLALWPLGRKELRELMRAFCAMIQEFAEYPAPLVAALGGHAVAGGFVLSLTADHRVLGDGAMMGLNGLEVGLPMPWTVSRLLAWAVPPVHQARVVLAGENLSGASALEAGLAQEVVPRDEVEPRARAVLEDLCSRPRLAQRWSKTWMREELVDSMRAREASRLEVFLDAWFDEETRTRMQRTVERLSS